MNAKMIVILMMLVLIALFIWSKFYRKNEQVMTKLEAESFEAVSRWIKNQTDENKEDALKKIIAHSIAKGLSPDKAKQLAQSQLTSLSA